MAAASSAASPGPAACAWAAAWACVFLKVNKAIENCEIKVEILESILQIKVANTENIFLYQ